MQTRSKVLIRDAAITAVIVAVLAGLLAGGLKVASLVRHDRATASRSTTTTTAPPSTAGTSTAPQSSATTAPPSTTGTTRSSGTSSKSSSSGGPSLGVYTGPGAAGAAEALDTTTGGKIAYVLDFLPSMNWTQLSDPSWLENAWAGSPFVPVLAVPMLPASGGTLAAGAAGDYDSYFTQLAQNLVSSGWSHAVLMIGWQPGSSLNPWQVTNADQAAAYVYYWNRIHTAMAGVAGAHFRFEWDAGGPGSPVSPKLTYPGNKAVNIIATDAFDVGLGYVPADQQWSTLEGKSQGLGWMATFAAQHHKPLALAMVGLAPVPNGGAGDNAGFLSKTLSWAKSIHATMVVLWDYATRAVTGGNYPSSAAALDRAIQRGIVGSPAADTH